MRQLNNYRSHEKSSQALIDLISSFAVGGLLAGFASMGSVKRSRRLRRL